MARQFVLTLVLLACAGCAVEPLVERVDPAGRRIVLLLDSSTSMRENDPGEAALAGAELALALVGTHDNVAVVPYSRRATVAVPLTAAGDTARRAELRRKLQLVTRSGVTNFVAALVKAREVLEAGDSPRGSAIILLTDGVPYRQARGQGMLASGSSLDDEVAAIAAKGWRIHAIALGPEASTAFLSRMVGETGGAVITASDADQLLTAFQEMATDALGYLKAERGSAPVKLLPHTRRLAFLGRWPREGEIGVPQHNDAPADAERLIRLPAQGAGPFAVTLIEDPEPGVWSAERAGASEAVTLVEPSFGLEFGPQTPPPEVKAGAGFEVRVELAGDADVIAQLQGNVSFRTQLVVGEVPGAWRPLESVGRGYGRQLLAPVVSEDTPASVVVEATIGGGDQPFVLRRSRALAIRAPRADDPVEVPTELPPPDLTVEPASFQRKLWEGEDPQPLRVRVLGDPERAVTVQAAGIEPLLLEPGAEGSLDLPCPARSGRLELTASAEGSKPALARVEVRVETFSLNGPATVQLSGRPAGFARQARLGYSTTPELPLEIAVSALRAPGGAQLTATIEGDRIRIDPPADTAPGVYRGRLRLRAKGLPAIDRRIEVTVDAAWSPPPPVVVQGSWGWATQPVEVSLPLAEEVGLAIELGPLTWSEGLEPGSAPAGAPPVIDPELDLRWKPLDGWGGEALGFETRRLALSVYLSSDLPTGRYRGTLHLRPERGQPAAIPVEVEVRR